MKHLKKFNEDIIKENRLAYDSNETEKLYTKNDLEKAYDAGYDSKECSISHDEEDYPYIEYNKYPTFDKWFETWSKQNKN